MEVVIEPDELTASRAAARVVAQLIHTKPEAVLGLATGSTPLSLYRELIRMHRREGLDFSRVTTFNLDEYLGLEPEHEQSYFRFMHENLFQHLNMKPDNIHIPDGMAEDVPASCRSYEQKIMAVGGIDLQVLGIGTNGHLGFNEPISSLASRTRRKTLTRQTLIDNARFFGDDQTKVPHHCITMGIGTIMDARMNLLLAFGQHKAKAVAAAVEGPVTAFVPASILQHHPAAKIFLDQSAAASLRLLDYYRWVAENNRPDSC